MRTHFAEEFDSGELKGDIGLLVSIDTDNVVTLWCSLQVIASVLNSYVKIWLVHIKVLPSKVDDLAVDFNTIYRNRPVDGAELAWNGACSQTDHAYTVYLVGRKGGSIEIGSDHEIVPGAVCEQFLGIVDGVNTQAFVEDQLCLVAHSYHL